MSTISINVVDGRIQRARPSKQRVITAISDDDAISGSLLVSPLPGGALSSLHISVPVTAPMSAYFRFSEEHDKAAIAAAAAADGRGRWQWTWSWTKPALFPCRNRSVHLAVQLLTRSATRLASHVESLRAAHLRSQSSAQLRWSIKATRN